MAEVDLQAVHDTLVSVAFEAGRMILAANPSSISTDTKMNGPSPPLPPFLPPVL
jgi:myo-inositol-1(or 4)-monophosphatase